MKTIVVKTNEKAQVNKIRKIGKYNFKKEKLATNISKNNDTKKN